VRSIPSNSSFGRDDRGVAPLIGFILIFGFLIAALAGYQATAVPQQNMDTEFEHNLQVQNELVELRDITQNSGLDELPRSTSITLGTHYRTRLITVNPPPPRGTLSTVDPETNVTVEINDHEANFSTKFVRYNPTYFEFRNAPRTTIEHTLLYNSFEQENENLTVEENIIFRSDRIIVPLITGNLSENGVEAASVSLDPVEKVSADVDENINVTFPTEAPDLWANQVEEREQVMLTQQSAETVTVEANVSTLIVYQISVDTVSVDDQDDTLSESIGKINNIPENGSGLYLGGEFDNNNSWDSDGNFEYNGDYTVDESVDAGVYTEGNVNIAGGSFIIDVGADDEVFIYTIGDFSVDNKLDISNVGGDVHVYVGGDVSVTNVDFDNQGDVIFYEDEENQDYGDLEGEEDRREDVEDWPDN